MCVCVPVQRNAMHAAPDAIAPPAGVEPHPDVCLCSATHMHAAPDAIAHSLRQGQAGSQDMTTHMQTKVMHHAPGLNITMQKHDMTHHRAKQHAFFTTGEVAEPAWVRK